MPSHHNDPPDSSVSPSTGERKILESPPGTVNGAKPGSSGIGVPSILLAILVVASPLAIGGVHAVTAAAIAAVALVGLWWALIPRASTTTAPVPLSIPALFCGAMALFCLLQLVPLPTWLYGLVQPAAFAEKQATFALMDPAVDLPGWHFFSVDPAATAGHAMKWLALAAACSLAAQVMSTRRGRTPWLGWILITGGVVALAGTVQHLSGTPKILGFYEAEITARAVAPFVNRNHAATYYALMTLVGLFFALDHLRKAPGLSALGVGAATLGLFLCAAHGSDGALLALALGVAATGVLAITRTIGQTSSRRALFMRVGLGVLVAATVASVFLPDHWTLGGEEEEDFFSASSAEARVEMTRAALWATADFPLGSGAGSVDRAMTRTLDWHRFGHSAVPTVENEPAEWVLTMGSPVALLALFVFGLLLFRTAPHLWRQRGRRGPAFAAVLFGFLGVISLFHFPFFTLGISLVTLVAAEACLDQRRDGLHLFRSPAAARLVALGLTAALIGVVALRAVALSPGAEEDLDVADPARAARAVHLYPTDGALISALSLRAAADGDADRSLELARLAFTVRPHPQQEYLLARALARAGHREQAADTYASLLGEDRRRVALFNRARDRLHLDLPEPALQARAMAQASPRNWWQYGRYLFREVHPLTAVEFALALVEVRRDHPEAHLLLIDLYHRWGQTELAEMYARALISLDLEDPDGISPAGLSELLDLLRRDRRPHEAVTIAHRAFLQGRGNPALARQVLPLLPDDPADHAERDTWLLEEALATGCQPPFEQGYRAVCWRGLGLRDEAQGDLESARRHFDRIFRLHDDPRALGGFLSRQGLCQDLATIRREHGDDGRHRNALARQARQCAE